MAAKSKEQSLGKFPIQSRQKQSTIKSLEVMTEKELAKEVLKGHILIDPCPTPWTMLKTIAKALGSKK